MSVLQNGSRQLFRPSKLLRSIGATKHSSFSRTWTCTACQTQSLRLAKGRPGYPLSPSITIPPTRSLSSSSYRRADVLRQDETSAPIKSASSLPTADPKELPSDSQSRRSDISKRFHAFMDDMLAKAAIAGQQVNLYTGTDYSGIETLRQQIVEQEQGLKARLDTVTAARDTYAAAHAGQAASQKEVVSLLERKSSWSPTDLDRYTSLIRSEHLHEQSVNAARQALAVAEKDLEEARSELERKERKKYHEEQIWSDTIRRNSTWVTFGLMGLNILLLIANIGIFEPWRRRRLVKEVKAALDERTLTSKEVTAEPATLITSVEGLLEPLTKSDTVIDDLVAPEEKLNDNAAAVEPPAVEVRMVEAAVSIEQSPKLTDPAQPTSIHTVMAQVVAATKRAWQRTQEVYNEWAIAPFGEGRMTLARVEMTSLAVESMVVGMAIMGCLVSILR